MGDEGRERPCGDGEGRDDLRALPATLGALQQAGDEQGQRGREQSGTDEIRRCAAGIARLGHVPGGEDRQSGHNGKVDPEDPAPVEALDDGASDDWAGSQGRAADRAPDPEREAAVLPLVAGADQRKRGGEETRCPKALQSAGEVEGGCVRCGRAGD